MLILSCYPPVNYFKEELAVLEKFLTKEKVEFKVEEYRNIDTHCDDLYILFNVHAVEYYNLKLPKKYIVMQFEQYLLNAFTDTYLQNLKNAVEVWEYSEENQKFFGKKGINSIPMTIGYNNLYSERKNEYIYDVLFIGTLNTRRKLIFENLNRAGLEIQHADKIWMDKKFELVDSSKININIHFETVSILETIRLMSLLSRGCFVITEKGIDEKLNEEYKKYCIVVDDIIELASACKYYLDNEKEREKKRLEFYNNYITKTSFSVHSKILQL